ncbi:hypothetical protein ACFWBB_03835 [Streptomyces sp. NPDC060000]|uniref:hypothetical protein n=1 Tax=Streptomyces sp. NPDC060000 TaxID=3347031 RepID=UPI0036C1D13B
MTEYVPAGAPLAADDRVAFQLHTIPEPVRVSPSTGDAEYARITLLATVTGTDQITLSEVTVKVLSGTDSPHLASSLSGVEPFIDRSGWTYTGMQQSTFSFMPSTGGETVDPGTSLSITLDRIPVNRAIGSSQVTATAHWNDDSGSSRTIFEVAKFPPGFYVRDFTASPVQVNNGGDVELRWHASADATLHLMWEGEQHDVTGRSEFTVHALRHTTVFYLRASHGTAEQTLGTVVSVPDPDLEVNNLILTDTLYTNRMETMTLDRIQIVPPSDLEIADQTEQRPSASAHPLAPAAAPAPNVEEA